MQRFARKTSFWLAIVLSVSIAAAHGAPSRPDSARAATSGNGDEGWSLDDIKDVCEAVHFVAITAGIVAGLSWFCLRFLPRDRDSRLEFEVELAMGGEQDSCQIVEVVALINNLSLRAVQLTECRFTLAAITLSGGSITHGSLGQINSLAPLGAGEWFSAPTVVDGGTRRRLACAALIPANATQVVVTGNLKHDGRAEPYTASRLVNIG